MTTTLIVLAIICIAAGVFIVIARGATAARLEEARKLENIGQRRRSIGVLRDVIDDNPSNGSARWMLANLLVKQGATSDAWLVIEPLLTRAAPPSADAVPDPASPWPREASLVDVLSLAVRCLLARGEGAVARRLLNEHGKRWLVASSQGAPIGGSTVDSSDLPQAMAFLRLQAEVAERTGEIAESLSAWRTLAAWRDLDADESLAFGALLLKQHKAEEAVPHLEKARDAGTQEPMRLLAEALTAVGRHVDAHRLWRQLYLDASGRARVTMGLRLAASLEDVGNPRGAVDALEQVATLSECLPAEAANALVQAGDLLQRMEKKGEAERKWKQALELSPDHPGACRRLGVSVRPNSAPGLVRYVRELPPPAFRKLFERILVDWGYNLSSVREVDRDTLHIVVTRLEDGKDRRKLVYVTRWENEVGQFPVQDLKLEVLEKKHDAGVFITMGHYSANAVIFASRSDVLELFSASELMPLIEHIELPR